MNGNSLSLVIWGDDEISTAVIDVHATYYGFEVMLPT